MVEDTKQMTVDEIRATLIEQFELPENVINNIKGKRNLVEFWEKLENEVANEVEMDEELEVEEIQEQQVALENIPDKHSIEWTDYVLKQLTEEEKVEGNPTVDGLRRIIEPVLECTVIENRSCIIQTPTPENNGRATVKVDITIGFEDSTKIIVSGCADCYEGNSDRKFGKHPVAMAETRAEGRALKKLLKLKKVVSAEEIAQEEVEDDPKYITMSQIRFLENVSQNKVDINLAKFIKKYIPDVTNVDNIPYQNAQELCKMLGTFENTGVSEELKGFSNNWKEELK